MDTVKVFVAGSRAVSRLNDVVRARLDRIMAEEHSVLIGDANGADKAVQKYLFEHQYRNVTVYFTGLRFRNNVGSWPARSVHPPEGVHNGFDFYAVKDRAMASEATHGLMLWDGESRGTFANINNLVRDRKPVVVYLGPAREFINVKTDADVDLLASKASRSSAMQHPA